MSDLRASWTEGQVSPWTGVGPVSDLRASWTEGRVSPWTGVGPVSDLRAEGRCPHGLEWVQCQTSGPHGLKDGVPMDWSGSSVRPQGLMD